MDIQTTAAADPLLQCSCLAQGSPVAGGPHRPTLFALVDRAPDYLSFGASDGAGIEPVSIGLDDVEGAASALPPDAVMRFMPLNH